MDTRHTAEAYVTQRYRRWRTMVINFDYKQKKALRIKEIIDATGGAEKRLIELGVGPGGIAAALSGLGFTIIGIDLSPDALKRAKEHCRSQSVHLLRASGFQLPFEDRSVKLIYASQVLHLFDEEMRLRLMSEVHRVLQPGGRFIFDMKNVWSHPVRYFGSTALRRRTNFPPRAQIRGLLREAGFSEVTTSRGVLPLGTWKSVGDFRLLRPLAHTTFFIGRRRS